ncbi:hypothetical protein ANCDUO_11029 [Ancylostoma duodenale]|uniref:EGF-like domain-containing protein n=1 Tax=Ancylostoma duodenale TaxID=51022 RepID=A0A0C2CPS5_9BILA|nr:hypothetical protein ANCDUO_11029 [Ancylostoma duodenale]
MPQEYICEPETSAKCKNGGFPHPRKCDECICPRGYGGPLCDDLPKDCKEGRKEAASGSWKEFSAFLQNPSNDGSYATCTYWITAPVNKKIQIKLDRVHTDATIGCATGGVEIKANADHTLTGYRYCREPDDELIITSYSNRVPIILYSGATAFATVVNLKHRYVD